MALSKVDICNLALGWLGGNLITSIDDNSTEAILCKANFDSARDSTLEDRNWTFAMSRKTLTPLAAAPDFGYTNAFQIPSDTIRIVQVDSNEDLDNDEEWDREADQLLSDAATLYVRYIRRITTTDKFSPGFSQTCAAKLAHLVAIAITGSKDMKDQMKETYTDMLEQSGTMDGLQGKNKPLRATKLTKVR